MMTNLIFYIYCSILLILSGDIEENPGPILGHENCLSLLHQNIRGIKNKLDFIVDNFLDYDILCFTETKLNSIISDDSLQLQGFNYFLRKYILFL